MIKKRFRTTLSLLLSICLIVALMGVSHLRAEDEDSEADREAAGYQTQFYTTPWGGTAMMGSFWPDYGYGEQGMVYQYTDPMTGAYVSYSSTGMGMGLGGPFAGYGGWSGPLAGISYGPFSYGGTPQVMPTPGYGTQGYASGGLFGPQTSYYQAQPGLTWMLGGGFGGMGGFGGLGVGYGGYGPYSGYGGYGGGYGGYGLYSGYGGYGGGYGGYGLYSGYGGYGGYSPYSGYGGYGGYPGGGYPFNVAGYW